MAGENAIGASSTRLEPARGRIRFLEVAANSVLFTDVHALADANRKYLGFMSVEAWADYATRGRLIAAVDDRAGDRPTLLGIASYRIGPAKATLAHLAVANGSRRRGIAAALVEEVSRRTRHVPELVVSCRRDFPAAKVWPRLGFIPFGERAGRGRHGTTLTTWKLLHGQPDLFTWSGSGAALTAAIDTNVFIDFHSGGATQSSHELVLASLRDAADLIDFVVTPELFSELDRHGEASDRRRLKEIAAGYSQINVPRSAVVSVVEELLGVGSPSQPRAQHMSDAYQVAYAIAGGVPAFVTSDDRAIARLSAQAASLGVEMLRPMEALLRVQHDGSAATYTPAALHGLSATLEDDPVIAARELVALNSNSSGETQTNLRGLVDQLWSRGGTRISWVLRRDDGAVLAGLAATHVGDCVEIGVLRVRNDLSGTVLAMFLVAQVRRELARDGVRRIHISDPHLATTVRDALEYHGFTRDGENYLASPLFGALSLDAIEARVAGTSAHDSADSETDRKRGLGVIPPAHEAGIGASARQLALLERRHAPVAVIDDALQVWSVPIRQHFAFELLGHGLQLSPRKDSLGLSVEHVYYSKSGNVPPRFARVLWYTSGKYDPGYYHHSFVVESETLPWKEAFRKYRRLGVYTYEQVRDAANSRGNVSVIHFGDTRSLPSPIRLSAAESLASDLGSKILFRGPWRIPNELARTMMEVGYGT